MKSLAQMNNFIWCDFQTVGCFGFAVTGSALENELLALVAPLNDLVANWTASPVTHLRVLSGREPTIQRRVSSQVLTVCQHE